jgi:tetratricopeptide (TPR) repeat protein
MALGEAQAESGEASRAVDSFHAAAELYEQQPGEHGGEIDAALLALARAFLILSRTADVIALAQQVRTAGRSGSAAMAEFLWGTALGHAGTDLVTASKHLQVAADLFRDQSPSDQAMLAAATFELGNIKAQHGDLHGAVECYKATLEIVEPATHGPALTWHILGHNNLAYHLHLLHDQGAAEHAVEGLRLAREKGVLTLQPFLLSTLGEIALAADELDTAEAYFREGLALARRLSTRERIAGLAANLGRLEARRGNTVRAVERLTAALAEADSLGSHHLGAQIRLWLVPLVPIAEARVHLSTARTIAAEGRRNRLLQEIEQLEIALGTELQL